MEPDLLMRLAIEAALNGKDSHRNVPVSHQRNLLGLGKEYQIKGKRVLDIGCGEGALVSSLRTEGIQADGIDPRAPAADYFTRRLITGIGQNSGIPAPNGTYDVITSFQNYTLNEGLGAVRDYCELAGADEEKFRESCENALYIISEIGRTLKKGGVALIFPFLDSIERADHILRMDRLGSKQEKIKRSFVVNYHKWEGKDVLNECLDTHPGLALRTVLRKT